MNKKHAIHWLHLSDLHFGARGKEVLHQITTEFFLGIKKLSERVAFPPDVILISGDIAFSGKPEEYQQADLFLSELKEVLNTSYGNCDPLLVCVPGNHDLMRPANLGALQYDVFNRYAEATDDDASVRYLNETLWNKKSAEILEPLFSGYSNWWNKKLNEARARSDVQFHTSHIPGDLCVEINIKDTFPLCMIGLNSAWLQYSDADFEGKLTITTRQFQSVLPQSRTGNPLDLFKRYKRALLVMHHPPSWFSATAQNRFNSEIFVPDRFDMCIYGHMHAGRARQTAVSGGAARYEFQSPSLCGLEYYGLAKEERAFGFSAGCITEDGEIRIWPYNRVSLAGKEHAFLWDQSFGDGAENRDGVLIRPSVAPPQLEALPQITTAAIEGALLHIALVDIHHAEQLRFASIDYVNRLVTEIAQQNSLVGRLERVDCSWDGKFTWLLSRGEGQSWNALLVQALKLTLQIASSIKQHIHELGDHEWIPQIGIALHIEHEGHRLPAIGNQADHRLVGEGIDFIQQMLPQPARPYIILSNEAYQYLHYTISNPQSLASLLREDRPQPDRHEHFTAEITRIRIPDKTMQRGTLGYREGYSLYVRSQHGDLYWGDAHLPPNQVQFEPIRPIDEQLLVDRLINSDRVCLIGVTNEHIDKCLHDALRKRNELQRGFWEEIKVVFLSRELLGLVLDYRCQTLDMAKASQNRLDGWGRGVRGVREFFLSCGADASPHWECLQFNFLLPFEAQRYIDENDSLIRVVPLLPNGDTRQGYHIEATAGAALHAQLSAAIDAVMRTATPLVEFNVYGHVEKAAAGKTVFRFGGVVSQRKWRRFKPPEGMAPCFPVSFILLHTDIGGVRRVMLQNRTPFNTGGDFDLYSLISGKVNDEDFFFPKLPTKEYQKLAYVVSNDNDDHLRVQLSRVFAEENKLLAGQPVSTEVLEQMWKNTAVRELNAELGLQIKPDRLGIPYSAPFLLDRQEGFQLYIKLYTLELQPEELAQIQLVRPHANLEPFTVDKMSTYKQKEILSVFLCTHFDEFILPLLHDMGIS